MDSCPDMDDLLDQLEADEDAATFAHKPLKTKSFLPRIERLSKDDAKGIDDQLETLQKDVTTKRRDEVDEAPEKTALAVESVANNMADILISAVQHFSSQANDVDDTPWEAKLPTVDGDTTAANESIGQNCSPPEEDTRTDSCDLPEADQDSVTYAEGSGTAPSDEAVVPIVVATVDQTVLLDVSETPPDDSVQSKTEQSEFEEILADCAPSIPTDDQPIPAQSIEEAKIDQQTKTLEQSLDQILEQTLDQILEQTLEQTLEQSLEQSLVLPKEEEDDDGDSVSSGEMERYLADVQLDMAMEEQLQEQVEERVPTEDEQLAAGPFIDEERLGDDDDTIAPVEASEKDGELPIRSEDITADHDDIPESTNEPAASKFFDATQLAGDLEAIMERPAMSKRGKLKAVVGSSNASEEQVVEVHSLPEIEIETEAELKLELELETSVPAERDGEEAVPQSSVAAEVDASTVENDAVDDGDYAVLVVTEEDDVPLDEEVAEVVNEATEAHEQQAEEEGDDPAQSDQQPPTLNEENSGPQPPSVVASTHDISASPVRRLTESEMMLGKVKPYWIPDPDSPACLICLNKFTVFRRRHHCRSCGRVLCATCCGKKAPLPYMGDDNKEYKVCEPCFTTLQHITEIEKESAGNRTEQQQQQHETDANATDQPHPQHTDGWASGSTGRSKPAIRHAVAPHGDGPSSSEGRRSVTFRDGVNPGSGVDAGNSSIVKPPKRPRSGRSGRGVSRRVLQLQIEEEVACLLPVDNDLLPMIVDGGHKQRAVDAEYVSRQLAAGKAVEIAIKRNLSAVVQLANLDCCGQGDVWCVSTRGLHTIGVEEIVVVYERLPGELDVHYDLLKMIDQAFDSALKSTPVRKVSDKVHCFHTFGEKKNPKYLLGGPFCSALVLFRPTVQCLSNLSLPSEPFLCGAFVHEMEMAWAIACPARLLYRLGLEYGYYPTPIVNKRSRAPVFGPVGHMSVMKVFTDFRNWSYRMSALAGSRVSLQDKRTTVYIPKSCANDMRALVESNKNMVAWAVSFNHEADGHLVCCQASKGGSYSTQVISIRGRDRKTTGATFVIFDGALKTADQTVQVNIVEDGVAIRVRPDAMQTLTERLSRAEDMSIEGGADGDTVSIVWIDRITFVPPGAVVSPVDNRSLETQYRYAVDPTRLVTATAAIPNANKWALRLAQVINVADGRLDETAENKVVALCEQIGIQLATTLAPFVGMLIARNQRSVVLRVRVGPDTAEYEAGAWMDGLEDEHCAWVAMLDDQLVATLFNISAYFGSGFHVELFFAIVETGYSVVE
uniref:FYVE-type domain-containing protein n=1 Tax=Plectus sambesii TaxID=2011161 RepID=A0A914W9T6_9BILA